jgi:hypothetical protein
METDTKPLALPRTHKATQAARKSFATRFPTEEAKRAHFSDLSRRACKVRYTLSGQEVEGLRSLRDSLNQLVDRLPDPSQGQEGGAV